MSVGPLMMGQAHSEFQTGKEADGVTGNCEKKATTETESQIVQLLPVVDKDFKITH